MSDTELRVRDDFGTAGAARPLLNERHWFAFVLAGYLLAATVAIAMAMLGVSDAIGYLASFLVLGSFASQSMMPLRILATLSNIAFIGYAAQRNLPPVLLLHATLLPVNLVRIAQLTGAASIVSRFVARRVPFVRSLLDATRS